jgi:hypothetical protein
MAEQKGGLTDRGRAMRRLLAAQERSGLTLAEFARRRSLRAGTLSWWRHRLRAEEPSGASAAGGRFIEVTPAVLNAEGRAPGFEIVLGDDTVVRVPGRFGEEDLRRLLAVLRC